MTTLRPIHFQETDAPLPPRFVALRARRRKPLEYVAALFGSVGMLCALAWGLPRLADTAGGQPPALDALRRVVPDSLLREARGDGSVHAGEVVLYAFVPHGESFANAVLFTDSAIVRRSPAGARRYEKPFALDLHRARSSAWLVPHGLFVLTRDDGGADTLYDRLSGAELARIGAVATTLREASLANDAKPK